MVRDIITDPVFLSRPSLPATAEDVDVIQDLFDTLKVHRANCVGLSANMIGVNKRIIVGSAGITMFAMINPVITWKSDPYETEEGCLSVAGKHKVVRYNTIEVDFCDKNFRNHNAVYTGWIAQIIQHEVDHCDGILI